MLYYLADYRFTVRGITSCALPTGQAYLLQKLDMPCGVICGHFQKYLALLFMYIAYYP